METNSSPHQRRWLVPLLASFLLYSLLISAALFSSSPSFSRQLVVFLSLSQIRAGDNGKESLFVEPKLQLRPQLVPPTNVVPRLAYLISGSAGDGSSLRRTLRALYHPANRYVVHLDLEAAPAERMELFTAIRDDAMYSRFRDVGVIVRANLVNYRGPAMVANTLHAAPILLKEAGD